MSRVPRLTWYCGHLKRQLHQRRTSSYRRRLDNIKESPFSICVVIVPLLPFAVPSVPRPAARSAAPIRREPVLPRMSDVTPRTCRETINGAFLRGFVSTLPLADRGRKRRVEARGKAATEGAESARSGRKSHGNGSSERFQIHPRPRENRQQSRRSPFR